MSTSLRKQVKKYAKITFPEVYPHTSFRLLKVVTTFINSRSRGLLVIPVTLVVFIIGQVTGSGFMGWMHIPVDTSRIIIDQRATNLATIFSITLVVIGWLLTNLSIRESLSFQLLFKKTYLYPIFYFISTLIGCLILFSLLRHESFINLGNVVIAGSILIIIALILITFLFIRFIDVVDAAFIYTALSAEVMKEVNALAKVEILSRKSGVLYNEQCKGFGLRTGGGFNTDLSDHTSVNIFPDSGEEDESSTNIDSFFERKSFEVRDINLENLEAQISKLNIREVSYYAPLQLGSVISENFVPFYIHNNIRLPGNFFKMIKKSFVFKPAREKQVIEPHHLTYFNDRFLKDVKEGKKDNIQNGLLLYAQIFDLENKIFNKC